MGGVGTRTGRWGLLVRALIIVLVASVGAGGTLPWVVRELAGPPAHVCHCSTHFECLCVRCHPDQDELRFSEESIKGQCGDEDTFFVGKGVRGFVPRTVGLPVAGVEVVLPSVVLPALVSTPMRAPPTPPPRA